METAQIQEVARNWSAVASTLVLILIRVSVVLAIGPLFSSRVFAARTKIVLAVLMTWLLVPVAMAQSKPPVLGVSSVLAEQRRLNLRTGIQQIDQREAELYPGHLPGQQQNLAQQAQGQHIDSTHGQLGQHA